jgi:hypothetical protein
MTTFDELLHVIAQRMLCAMRRQNIPMKQSYHQNDSTLLDTIMYLSIKLSVNAILQEEGEDAYSIFSTLSDEAVRKQVVDEYAAEGEPTQQDYKYLLCAALGHKIYEVTLHTWAQ